MKQEFTELLNKPELHFADTYFAVDKHSIPVVDTDNFHIVLFFVNTAGFIKLFKSGDEFTIMRQHLNIRQSETV